MALARRALAEISGRVNAHPLLRWRFLSAKADRLVISPQDLRTADSTRAREIYAGRFAFAGKVVICDGRSPFEMNRRPRNGRRPCSASAGCAICGRRNQASRAPMRVRWSMNGFRFRAAGTRSGWRPEASRAGSSPGSARRR